MQLLQKVQQLSIGLQYVKKSQKIPKNVMAVALSRLKEVKENDS